VARALEVRRSAYAVNDRLETIDRIERETPRWTPALATLTEVLPRSTYLVSLTTEGLSMRLGGVTRSSDTIVPELEDSPLFGDVTLANVRAAGGGTEFDLSMALRPTTTLSAIANGGGE
jgi:Tfp pilus assembly protein PilN